MNFKEGILNWYEKNMRSLPWREVKDPYHIWVSEVILQQTRINQGLPYYYKFIEDYPNVIDLANATEQAVLNTWKGLGYYSRARNMHHTAIMIKDHFNGVFPSDYKTLLSLKGIGEYTAAAISSICSDEKRAVVDGNVVRVLSRYFGILDPVGSSTLYKKIRWISNSLITEENPGNYNQAIMEYGALLCTPQNPNCDSCFFKTSCFANSNNMTAVFPVKKKPMTKKTRFLNYLHIVTREDVFILRKRSGNDIWKNMWDMPVIESDKLIDPDDMILNDSLLGFKLWGDTYFAGFSDKTHVLTHQLLRVRFFTYITDSIEIKDQKTYVLTNYEDHNYPIPRLIENFLKNT